MSEPQELTPVTIQDWTDATRAAVEEFATTALGYSDVEFRVYDQDQLPDGVSGAYIPMVSEGVSVQIGVIARSQGCEEIARALLCMEPEDGELDPSDMVDALGEIVNILAGVVKGRLIEREPSIRLGLPVFLHGRIELNGSYEHSVTQMSLGPVDAQLHIIRQSYNG
ncbi:MAG: chemotaxis protein CheX [Planctomycetota bacterium]